MSTPRGKCTECGGYLVPVGSARSNGKNHNDWKNRGMHKKCWTKKQGFSGKKYPIRYYNSDSD